MHQLETCLLQRLDAYTHMFERFEFCPLWRVVLADISIPYGLSELLVPFEHRSILRML